MKTEIVFINALKREVIFYIGKNQSENFEVIDKGANDDLWFHAADVSSCHVVCQVPMDIDKKCCVILLPRVLCFVKIIQIN